MAKGIYKIFRTKEELYRHNEDIRHFARVWQLDQVTMALGRMGFRESKFREFDRVLSEVEAEYIKLHAEDHKDDKEMVYSRELFERELRQYVGKFYADEKQRYAC